MQPNFQHQQQMQFGRMVAPGLVGQAQHGMQPQQGMHPGMIPGMMQQQMFMPQQYAHQMYPSNQQMGMMGPGHVGTPGMQFGAQGQAGQMVPPAYNPQMGQNYQAKKDKRMMDQHRKIEGEKKRMEQEIKQRQFVEQKKKLQAFSSIGSRKIDPESYMKSLIGDNGPTQGGQKSQQPPQMPPNQSRVACQEEDDSFGDFLTGPVALHAEQPVAQSPSTPAPTNSLASSEQNSVNGQSVNHSAPAQAPSTQPPKKDLMSMMFECSDLNAPKTANTFVKKVSVKDVAPKKVAANYSQSQKSRLWTDTAQFSDLFISQDQGNPEAKKVPAKLPKWLSGEVAPPKLYMQVQEASTRDEKIDTSLLYPILLRSGLNREVLGQIWSMANRSKPGELTEQELYMVLAMISVAQNNLDYSKIDVLLRCPQAPLPNLGQYGVAQQLGSSENERQEQTVGRGDTQDPGRITAPPTQQPYPQVHPQGHVATPDGFIPPHVHTPPLQGHAPHMQGHAPHMQGHAPHMQGHAPHMQGHAPPLQGHASLQGRAPIPQSHVHQGHVHLNSQGHTYAPPGVAPGPVGAHPGPVHPLPPGVAHPGLPHVHPGPVTSQHVAEFLLQGSDRGQGDAGLFHPNSFVPPSNIPPTIGKQPVVDEDFDDFQTAPLGSQDPKFTSVGSASQPSGPANNESVMRSGQPVPAQSQDLMSTEDKYSVFRMALSGASQPEPEFDDFKSATGPSDEFADFSQAFDPNATREDPSSVDTQLPAFKPFCDINQAVGIDLSSALSSSASDDKIAALKALVQDKNLYKEKRGEEGQTEEWADFQMGAGATDIVEPLKNDPFITSSNQPADISNSASKGSEDWASFPPPSDLPSALPNLRDTKTTAKTGNNSVKPLNFDLNHKDSLPSKPYKPGTVKKDYFGRPLAPAVNAGTGVHPLDIHPPEIPDVPDDDSFDEFGTFQNHGDHNEGISSLRVGLYNVVDDDMFAYNSRPPQHLPVTADVGDTVSMSSYEFTGNDSGWKNHNKESRDDGHSVSSLDLQRGKSSSKEGSPAGGDSQSVSSLEFTCDLTSRRQDTPGDDRSVASLELRMATVTLDTPSSGGADEGFGDFNSAPEHQTNLGDYQGVKKPKTASELLSEGGFPGIGSISDRYVSLSKEPQDCEKHACMWTRCLDKCCEMIQQASMILTSIQEPPLIAEILHSEQGMQYLHGIVEVFRVLCRIKTAMKGYSVNNDELTDVLKETNIAWSNLMELLSDTPLYPMSASVDFSTAILKGDSGQLNQKACGLCLLDVNVKPKGNNYEVHNLTYGGRQYHTTCANFWVNCVDSILPTLTIPELL